MKVEGEAGTGAAGDADTAMSHYAQGNDEAFEIVYDAVAPRLEGYLRRHVRETSRIEDIIQQTFMHIHHKRGTFTLGAEVLPWACTIARNFMIDSARKTQRESSKDIRGEREIAGAHLISALANGEEIIQARQTRDIVATAFGRLSAAQREAFTLVKLDGLSVAEAAQVLATTANGVKLRIHKANLALRAAVARDREPDADVEAPSTPVRLGGL